MVKDYEYWICGFAANCNFSALTRKSGMPGSATHPPANQKLRISQSTAIAASGTQIFGQAPANIVKQVPEKTSAHDPIAPPPIEPPPPAMAPLTTASRTCLRGLSRSGLASLPIRALSTSTALSDSAAAASSYSSPFKGETTGTKIPDWTKYLSKNKGSSNALYGYFMVGAMGAISAAGAKSTVQGAFCNGFIGR
jgi:hypothetical protein